MIEIRINITKDFPDCCSTHVYTDPVAAILGLSHTLGIATEYLKTTKKTKQSREQVNLDPRSDISKAWHQVLEDARTRKQDLEITRKALEIATGFIKGISQTIINDCDNQYVVLGNFKKFAQDTLNQIKTALEQKDVK